MSRTAASFKRGGARFRSPPSILVLCEDTKSGKYYLEDAARHYRVFAQIEFAHCGHTDPKGIVLEAIKRQRNFDEIYCALDRDSHHGWDEANRLALASDKVKIIASHPCFEYWLLCHFVYSRAPYAAAGGLSVGDQVIRELRRCGGMENYAKGTNTALFNDLVDRLEIAKVNGARSVMQSDESGNPNPSTHLHTLLERFSGLSDVQPR